MHTWTRTLGLAALITLLPAACAPASVIESTTAPMVPTEADAATLPPSWTSTPLPEPGSSPTINPAPTDTTAPNETQTSGPPETATREASPTIPPASPTPPNTEPERLVTAAWEAFLARDEATLASYYNEHGQRICTLGFGSMLRCVGVAYQARRLNTLENWYTLEPIYLADEAAFVFLVTKWAESDSYWEHMFTAYKEEGVWMLDEPETIIYEYTPGDG